MSSVSVKTYILNNLSEAKVMQLATVGDNGRPWISNVYFVADKAGNIYWLSEPSRRHSKDIESNPDVSVSVVVKSDMPVIGVQAEGTASINIDLKTIKLIMTDYVKKYGVGKEFYQRAINGIGKHKVYKMTVKRYSLFDEVNFPKDSPREWVL